MAFMSQNEGQSAATGAMSGAATGAAIGSFFPGAGTAIGAGVGLLAGGIMGYMQGKSQDDAEKAAEKERIRALKVSAAMERASQEQSEGLLQAQAQRAATVRQGPQAFEGGGSSVLASGISGSTGPIGSSGTF